jgi:hypothetical protein
MKKLGLCTLDLSLGYFIIITGLRDFGLKRFFDKLKNQRS